MMNAMETTIITALTMALIIVDEFAPVQHDDADLTNSPAASFAGSNSSCCSSN
jgi:hypothetical protein